MQALQIQLHRLWSGVLVSSTPAVPRRCSIGSTVQNLRPLRVVLALKTRQNSWKKIMEEKRKEKNKNRKQRVLRLPRSHFLFRLAKSSQRSNSSISAPSAELSIHVPTHGNCTPARLRRCRHTFKAAYQSLTAALCWLLKLCSQPACVCVCMCLKWFAHTSAKKKGYRLGIHASI